MRKRESLCVCALERESVWWFVCATEKEREREINENVGKLKIFEARSGKNQPGRRNFFFRSSLEFEFRVGLTNKQVPIKTNECRGSSDKLKLEVLN